MDPSASYTVLKRVSIFVRAHEPGYPRERAHEPGYPWSLAILGSGAIGPIIFIVL